MKCVRRRNEGSSRGVRAATMLAVVVVIAFAQVSASAKIELPELPLPTATPVDEPFDLEDLLNLDELLNGGLPASGDLGDAVGGATDTVSGLLGAEDGGSGDQDPSAKAPTLDAPKTDSWSTDRVIQPPAYSILPPVRMSSTSVRPPSYAAAVGDGFSRAARRAARLAGPVAAPMFLALFAVGLLFVAARGPGRMIKVEEERKAFREHRTFRL